VETSSTFASLREARAFKAERDGEAAIGARRFDPRLGRVSLSGIWTQYSASKRPAVSPKTWSGYTQHWELRISPRFGHVPLDEITRKDVQQFIDTLTVGHGRNSPPFDFCGRSSKWPARRPHPHQPGARRIGGADSGPRAPPLPHHDSRSSRP
jgi:hypothetical protein